jgi:mono/diheme cytochrome c family protein
VVTSSDPGARILLSRDSRLDTGHGIFHANSGGGLACASCHPEGGDDGRVWRFTAGFLDPSGGTRPAAPVEARRTQNLRGGVMATAPFHWNGDLKDMTTLMTEVFVKRMGGPNIDATALGTLSRWLDAVPALPPAAALDSAAVDRGRALFNQTTPGCARCHAGALLTDNKTEDVGTGRAFQVPSLRGVRYRAPYMHDGCAATLADRFNSPCGGGEKHGVTATLTAGQVSDLVARHREACDAWFSCYLVDGGVCGGGMQRFIIIAWNHAAHPGCRGQQRSRRRPAHS